VNCAIDSINDIPEAEKQLDQKIKNIIAEMQLN
jgi:hypothetical protein